MRNAFVRGLVESASVNESVFLLCGDLGYSVLEPFARAYPSRFLNVGVAEQNMISMASGLAKEGYNVFVYSIGNFPTLRCLEQIRYDVCYHERSVKIVAVGGGYAYGPLGASHHTTEDLGVLRVLPRMRVAAPGDPTEAFAITRYFAGESGPGYLRLNKAGEVPIHQADLTISKPEAYCLRKGTGTAVLANGSMVQDVCSDPDIEARGWSFFSVPFVKPLDISWLLSVASSHEEIVTLEEHQLACGFGSAIAEALVDLYSSRQLARMPRVRRVGIADAFIETAGTQGWLKRKAGLFL